MILKIKTLDMTKQKIKDFAINAHEATNHKYGDNLPYSYHLQMVADFAMIFGDAIPEGDFNEVVYPACWLHDVIEDCRMTYNDVKEVAGEKVADVVYALTNEKGKNRKERASFKYYMGIQQQPYATFVKMCDRLANIKHSKESGSKMLDMYRKEHAHFIECLAPYQYPQMIKRMEELLATF